ncbi:MAG: TolC family protein [Dysgonomonas mossii]|uniref:TolC family protein n=1 Tax=Dysgonomonas mossii TaxID=163665 RepID=UPI001D82EFA5|nr:TolC family protein [Dysgonomonas mossii]MBS5795816.1 TolC family protein [Dysgonomonas mossii]MBS7111276.1 TolC family protein [Dysgonomonas mossii]
MKKSLIIITYSLFFSAMAFAQSTLTIEQCQQMAKENYPLIKRYGLIERSKEYNLSNAGKGYLPQFSLSAKASYQSEVTKIPIDIQGIDIKGLSKDQYSATIDIMQTIWDGGVISSKKDITKASSYAEQKQLDVDMYKIVYQVNQMYFGILLLDARLKQNTLLQEELQRNFDLISSYITNGIANQSDLDAIKVEQLKTVQNKAQIVSNKKAYLDMLGILIGQKLNENIILPKPNADNLTISSQVKRPELELFDAQLVNLEKQKKVIKAGYMPKLVLFLTGGYGKPALNMLNNDFSAYYIGGIRLSWNFGSLYTQKNDRKLIETNQDNITTSRETFLFNTSLETSQEQNEINKNKDLLKYDDDIVILRNNVKRATEAKVANGTSTVIDLMRDVNAEDLAKQDRMQHEIELLQAIYNLKYTTNN